MKKITFLVLALFVFGLSYGQTVLSHSVDNTVSDGGTVACAGGGTTADNIFYRAYTPSDFGFTGDFVVMGANFPLAFTDVSGGATVDITVRFYTSDDVFPAGVLTEIASEVVTLSSADDFVVSGAQVEVLLTTTATVDAGTEVIVATDIPDNIDPVMYDARIGFNALGQNDPSYLSSQACGLAVPGDFADIGFPDNHLILDLVGDSPLSTDDLSIANQIAMYPNPTNGDITLDFARSLGQTQVQITNITGQIVMDTTVDGVGATSISTSRLSSGIYFAQIATENASTVIKFVKN